MTITIVNMRDAATKAAVKAGGVVVCRADWCNSGVRRYPILNGNNDDIVGFTNDKCPTCHGHGTIHYHYVGRAIPRLGIKGSPLGNPWKVGGKGILACKSAAQALHQYEVMLRTNHRGSSATELERQRSAALAAIADDLRAGRAVRLACWCCGPCTVEEATGKCHAAVVAKVALESAQNGGGA